jgi:hypothetical protein
MARHFIASFSTATIHLLFVPTIFENVAAGVPPAVEPGFQPGGKNSRKHESFEIFASFRNFHRSFRAAGRPLPR